MAHQRLAAHEWKKKRRREDKARGKERERKKERVKHKEQRDRRSMEVEARSLVLKIYKGETNKFPEKNAVRQYRRIKEE